MSARAHVQRSLSHHVFEWLLDEPKQMLFWRGYRPWFAPVVPEGRPSACSCPVPCVCPASLQCAAHVWAPDAAIRAASPAVSCVSSQPWPSMQDGAFAEQLVFACAEPRQTHEPWCVVQRFWRDRVRQVERLLKKADGQHHCLGKRQTANGKRPLLALREGVFGAMSVTCSHQRTARFISSRDALFAHLSGFALDHASTISRPWPSPGFSDHS